MLILSRYLLKTVAWTTMLIALVLTLVIWLTQSLRLLDFIINGGAPISLFASMLVLTMPKFLEVIFPISLALAIAYSLNKFSSDSELVVMQNAGASPARIGSGIIFFSLIVAFLVLGLAGWATPLANRELDRLRDVVKSEYSMGLLRPGVFNVVGNDTTIYIAERSDLKDLKGVFIHIQKPNEPASTITAQNGGLISQNGKPYVIVFDGMRQQFNPQTGTVETLKFERYSVNLSSLTNTIVNAYTEPKEQTLPNLLASLQTPDANPKKHQGLNAELHNRLSKAFLTLAFGLLATVPFLISHYNRRGQSVRITMIIIGILLLQSLYLAATYFATRSMIGVFAVYIIPIVIILALGGALLEYRQTRGLLTPIQWLLGGKERLI